MLIDESHQNDISVTNFLNLSETMEDAGATNAVERYLNGPPELSLYQREQEPNFAYKFLDQQPDDITVTKFLG